MACGGGAECGAGTGVGAFGRCDFGSFTQNAEWVGERADLIARKRAKSYGFTGRKKKCQKTWKKRLTTPQVYDNISDVVADGQESTAGMTEGNKAAHWKLNKEEEERKEPRPWYSSKKKKAGERMELRGSEVTLQRKNAVERKRGGGGAKAQKKS